MSIKFTGPRKWIFKRDNKIHRFQLRDRSGYYDLTNVVEITFTVREIDLEGSTQIYQCTKTGGNITIETQTGDDIGKLNVIVEPADTASASAGRRIYDIQVEDENNKIHTFGKGIYEIIQDVTYT